MSQYGSYYGSRRRRSSGGGQALFGIVVLLAIVAIWGVSCGAALHTQRVTIHAYAKERGEDKRVYTTDGDGVYTVNDAWLQGVTDSGTTYARIPVPFAGAADPSKVVELNCKVNGIRFSPLSKFKNILECDPVTKPSG